MSALFCRSSVTVINLQVRTVTQRNSFLLQNLIFNITLNIIFNINIQEIFRILWNMELH